MNRSENQPLPPATYTDAPTRLRLFSSGKIEMETPRNILVHWKTNWQESPAQESPLAIRWAFNGQRIFESGSHRSAVDDRTYLLTNDGQSLASSIDSPVPVECYTVCFQPRFASDILRSLVSPTDHLLDDPRPDTLLPVHFMEKGYLHDDIVSPRLFRLQRGCRTEAANYGWFEEQFHLLVVGLLQAHRNVLREVERIPACRAATRQELYSRLHQARDYMEAGLFEPLSLPDIAGAACLSTHHFLRLFKQVFRETPHQYLIRRRIEQTCLLLKKTNLSITDICYLIGFESPGSFSWTFRKRMGVSPEAYRVAMRVPVFAISAPQSVPAVIRPEDLSVISQGQAVVWSGKKDIVERVTNGRR